MPELEDMMTVAQAAEAANRSESTLRHAIRKGQLEAITIHPRFNMVTREALKAWMEGRHYGKPGPKKKSAE